MHKRERLGRTIAGEAVDRAPVALWRAFPGDDQRAQDLAQAVIAFQQTYDWDFVHLMPAQNYMLIDYGLQDDWQGSPLGERVILKSPVKRSLDWTELRTLDPERGEYGKVLTCLRGILGEMDTPVIVTLDSPLTQAQRLVGKTLFLRHLRKFPDRVITGLNTITESTLRYVDALRSSGIAGVCYRIEHADYEVFSENEYDLIGMPYDRRILDHLPENWWFNLVSLQGQAPMLRFVNSLRSHALQYEDASSAFSSLRTEYSGALCGGLTIEAHLLYGTPTIIRNAVRDVIVEMNAHRLIVSASGAIPITTPISHLRAVRAAVDLMRK
ncbi:MAG: hypothetical protein MUF87_04490 [Anaerolineae bacterium]|jgi:uroporphyrinogen decarboxylase|nr:hypothetical protein [Anaerolineae bacterium]